jgi:hypothetical protein
MTKDFNHHVGVLEGFGHRNNLFDDRTHSLLVSSFRYHLLLNCMERLHIRESFGVVFEEWSSREKDLSVDDIIFA